MDAPDSMLHPMLAGIFLVAGLVKGVSGMGLPTVAMALLGLTMPAATAAALLVVPSLVTNLWQLAAGPDVRGLVARLWSMMLGIVAGTLTGAALLARIDPLWSAGALGGVLVLYASHGLLTAPAPAASATSGAGRQ